MIFFEKNELEKILEKACRQRKRRFLLIWNRGLGDIALGLYRVVQKIKEFIPEAKITILTRRDLEEGFFLLEDVQAISAPNWERGKPVNLKQTLELLGKKREDFEVIIEKVDPTRWFKNDLGKFVPKLKWRQEYDQLWRKFNLAPNTMPHIAIHLHTETEEFYSANKNWPPEKFKEIFVALLKEIPLKIIFLGLRKSSFETHSQILDLRGETSILEMLSIIKNCCPLLIAPDGGVLSLVYYLHVEFPITIISLWGDANQGVLKQSVPSPNPKLKHMPIIGRDKDIKAITTEEVLAAVGRNLKESFQEFLATRKDNLSTFIF